MLFLADFGEPSRYGVTKLVSFFSPKWSARKTKSRKLKLCDEKETKLVDLVVIYSDILYSDYIQ